MEQHSEVQVLFYLSILTPIGEYYGMNDEASESQLLALEENIMKQEISVLRLETSKDITMFFGEEIINDSIIAINRVNSSLPF